MAKYLKNNKTAQKPVQVNNASTRKTSLERVRRNVYRQAALAILTILLTVVILFAMTSAWYTNIVQSSGLMFEAEAWGFNGTITINDAPILAAPGDDGIVSMRVENDSDTISAISVNVSKNGMSEEMQKRLFFYVDTRMNREGETMSRVYLNRYEGYTYNVFGNGELRLTEQISNAPVIKWEWVYDVLGYYVLAQPYEVTTKTETVVVGEDGSITPVTEIETTIKMDIKEYLRPIEYDFDKATTVVNTEGDSVTVELDTINGVISPETFLWRLSQEDGYKGSIEPDDKQDFGNYYVVDVDENGYGVYAYLCNYAEIQMATVYDTNLGKLAYKNSQNMELTAQEQAMLRQKATITLSAQKNESTAVHVTTLSSLQNAIASDYADVVQLTSNISIPEGERLTIPANSKVMLDLGGYSITNVEGTAIKAEPGSSLTMTNGTLIQAKQTQTENTSVTCGIYTIGAEVVMSNMKINDFQYGIYFGDHEKENELDSRVHVLNSSIAAEDYAVAISGNGLLSDQKTQLIIENSTLTSNSIVISGSGNVDGNGRWGTDIQIINSTIAGTKRDDLSVFGGGIYHPQKDSTLMVYNSYVEGYNGIGIKGGNVSIVDSTIKGLGDYTEPAFAGSGYTDTGDAVYIETNYDYEIQLRISGSKSILTHRDAQSASLRVFEEDATNVLVQIEGGTFDEEQPVSYLAEGSIQNQVNNKTVVSKAE